MDMLIDQTQGNWDIMPIFLILLNAHSNFFSSAIFEVETRLVVLGVIYVIVVTYILTFWGYFGF